MNLGAYMRPLLVVSGTLVAVVIGFVALVSAWAWWENRKWIVSQAVDQGACSEARHQSVRGTTGPSGSREVIYGSAACMDQIKRMLVSAPYFTCSTRGAYTACNHPLNSTDSSTSVYAVIGPNAALLEVEPS